jgi:hypothetical protein
MNTQAKRKHRSTSSGWVGMMAIVLLLPSHALAVDSSLLRSLVVPGVGQAHQGHYTRAAIYAGTAVLSGFGLLVSQIHYNESVDRFNEQKRIYAGYEDTLRRGGVVSIEDINSTYTLIQAEHKSAEDRFAWRNGFLVAFVATYAINIVDVLISKPDDGDRGERLSVEVNPGSLRITRTFRF